MCVCVCEKERQGLWWGTLLRGGAGDAGIRGGARACPWRVAGAGWRDQGPCERRVAGGRLDPVAGGCLSEAETSVNANREFPTWSARSRSERGGRGSIIQGRNQGTDFAWWLWSSILHTVRVPDPFCWGRAGLRGLVGVSCLLGIAEPPLAELGQKSG